MIRFAADEDFNNDVVRALRRALLKVNILGVREAGRGGHQGSGGSFVRLASTAAKKGSLGGPR